MKLNDALYIKTEKRIAAMDEAEKRRTELHARFPRIESIDNMLRDIPMRAITGEDVEALRRESECLSDERARILESAGYVGNYDEPRFECTDCNDGGYCGLKLCHCVRELMSEENYRASSLAGGLVGKSFENFSLSYFAEGQERNNMAHVLEKCSRYAEIFPNHASSGLLFIGATGLGKTHMSAAIASKVAANGFSVVYESAQQIYDTIDAVRFNRADISERKKYENCSLLIIDDLGAEYVSPYSISSLTSLIDLRIVNRKQTVISTNLNPAAINKTYGERLCSRLMGEFTMLKFVGKDIRMQKIKGANE